MLRNIRLDHLRPDESRTSRLIDALKLQAGNASTEMQKVTSQAVESVEVPTASDEPRGREAGDGSELEASSTSSSSSSSEDEGDDNKHDVERHDWIAGPQTKQSCSQAFSLVYGDFLWEVS